MVADERQVLQLLRAADPARDAPTVPHAVDPLWQTIAARIERGEEQEGSAMGTRLDERTHDRTPDEAGTADEQRWWARAAVWVVIATGVAVAVWALTRIAVTPEVVTDEQGVPAPVDAYLTAWNAGDTAAVDALLAADAAVPPGPADAGRPLTGEASRIPQWRENMFVLEASLTVEECTVADGEVETGRLFACEVVGSTAVSRAVGEEYRAPVRFWIGEEGRILGHDLLHAALDERGGALERMGAWLYEHHFDDYQRECDATFDPLTVGTDCMEYLAGMVDRFAASR